MPAMLLNVKIIYDNYGLRQNNPAILMLMLMLMLMLVGGVLP
ncbi:hypothetical protein [Thalassospira sp. NFXS8]